MTAQREPPRERLAGWRVRCDACGWRVGRTPGATITGLPRGVETPMSRCDDLWSIAGRRNSTNLGTLQSYVTARLR